MARLLVNQRSYDIDVVVFDKDGTLIDFDTLWGTRTERAVEALVAHISGEESLRAALSAALGYDPVTKRTIPDGPLAVTSTAKLLTIGATVLYQHGHAWEKAEELIEKVLVPVMLAPLSAGSVQPQGDLPGVLGRLVDAGITVAVATSDDRSTTAATLDLLGVKNLVGLLICGDDDLPNKPAPEGLWRISECTGVQPARIMMVGDTVSDMLFGANAGVACKVAVLAGAGDRRRLVDYADEMIYTIDEIRVVTGE